MDSGRLARRRARSGWDGRLGGVMFAKKTSVLLVISRDVLDRARVLAGRATAVLKLPVSLQIVLRVLISEALKRSDDRALLANIEGQAKAVRDIRRAARHGPRR